MQSKWANLGCFAAIFGLILNRRLNREAKQAQTEATLAARDEAWAKQVREAQAKASGQSQPPTSEGDAHNGFGGYQSGGYN